MNESGSLSCAAKLARVVLDNCGPLSPAEVAEEARLSEAAASEALAELEEAGFVDCVCGLCESKQQVYELAAASEDGA
jgi:DNA-binding IclR family transcriptional regulator